MEQVIDIVEEEEISVEQKRGRFKRKQTHPHTPKETEFSALNRANAEMKRIARQHRNMRNAVRGGFLMHNMRVVVTSGTPEAPGGRRLVQK